MHVNPSLSVVSWHKKSVPISAGTYNISSGAPLIILVLAICIGFENIFQL